MILKKKLEKKKDIGRHRSEYVVLQGYTYIYIYIYGTKSWGLIWQYVEKIDNKVIQVEGEIYWEGKAR